LVPGKHTGFKHPTTNNISGNVINSYIGFVEYHADHLNAPQYSSMGSLTPHYANLDLVDILDSYQYPGYGGDHSGSIGEISWEC
jgi:hypothetical protein